jgi:hypothetical protein
MMADLNTADSGPSSDESSVSSNDGVTQRCRKKRRVVKEFILKLTLAILSAMLEDTYANVPRMPNVHRDRGACLSKVRSWTDDLFRKSFRIPRVIFNKILTILSPVLSADKAMATRSSGSTTCPELMMYVALRFMAGASYLEFAWYEISLNHCIDVVMSVCSVIVSSTDPFLNNIILPTDNDSLIKLAELFSDLQKKCYILYI